MNETTRRSAEKRVHDRNVAGGMLRRVARHRVVAVLIFLSIFPLIAPYEALATDILIYGLYAMGFNLVFGYMGVLSFGHAAFFGVGAYATGIAMVHFGVPWVLAIIIGVLMSGLTAMIMGGMAIRTRGIYFAMVTLALAQCVYYIVYHSAEYSGGEDGLTGVSVRVVELGITSVNMVKDPLGKYYIMLAFVAVAIFVFSRILASPFGAVLEAIRENEDRARACGYNVLATKWVSFVLSGMFCGLAGALSAIHLSVVPIESLHYHQSGLAVMVALLGGMGTFFGPFIGAIAFLMLEDVITLATTHWQLFLGSIFIFFVLFFPRGIWGSILHWLSR